MFAINTLTLQNSQNDRSFLLREIYAIFVRPILILKIITSIGTYYLSKANFLLLHYRCLCNL